MLLASIKQFIVQKQTKVSYSLQRYLGSLSISVENREFCSYMYELSLNLEVLCKWDEIEDCFETEI